ncbi:MAG: hypothetical protein ABSF37_02070 [Sedimentisphaerales bacterium]
MRCWPLNKEDACEGSHSNTEKRCVLDEEMKKVFRQKDFKSAPVLLKVAKDILASHISSDIKMPTIVNKYRESA